MTQTLRRPIPIRDDPYTLAERCRETQIRRNLHDGRCVRDQRKCRMRRDGPAGPNDEWRKGDFRIRLLYLCISGQLARIAELLFD